MTPAPQSAAERFSEAIGAALQADGARARRALDGTDLSGLPERDRQAGACMLGRFSQDDAPALPDSDRMTLRALALYHGYWHRALMMPSRREAEERRLATGLRELLRTPPDYDFDQLEALLAQKLEQEGVHSLQGRTGLLRELMMWTKQEERIFRAALPEGDHQVKVYLLDGFASLGWGAYATCTRASTGGWATDQALFAVVPKYPSLDHEEFRVTFLGHEAQHFADKRRFKQLKPWELEYRAKLTELAQAEQTRARVIGKFLDDQGDDPASPHSYANRKVLAEMARKLKLKGARDLLSADLASVQAAAADLLRQDSSCRAATAASK